MVETAFPLHCDLCFYLVFDMDNDQRTIYICDKVHEEITKKRLAECKKAGDYKRVEQELPKQAEVLSTKSYYRKTIISPSRVRAAIHEYAKEHPGVKVKPLTHEQMDKVFNILDDRVSIWLSEVVTKADLGLFEILDTV